MLEGGSDIKFQLLSHFNIVGPFLGLTRNLGARQRSKLFKKQSNQHTSYRLKARSSSGGVAIVQMEALLKCDDWRRVGGDQEEVLELVAEIR
jgi:hypothetical protein